MGGGGVIRSSVISLTNFPPRNNSLTAQHQGPDRQLGQSKRGMNRMSFPQFSKGSPAPGKDLALRGAHGRHLREPSLPRGKGVLVRD